MHHHTKAQGWIQPYLRLDTAYPALVIVHNLSIMSLYHFLFIFVFVIAFPNAKMDWIRKLAPPLPRPGGKTPRFIFRSIVTLKR